MFLWHASTLLPEEYAPGSTPRQIVLTLDPAGAWRKDTTFLQNHKTFFQRKRTILQSFSTINYIFITKRQKYGLKTALKRALRTISGAPSAQTTTDKTSLTPRSKANHAPPTTILQQE
jgi:hypothetical protein